MCWVMYLLHCFVNLFLEQGLKLWQAYEAVSAIITADGMQVACTPLVDWLQAACTHFTANVVPTKVSLVADANLLQHCWELVLQDPPILDPAHIQCGGQHIMTTIGKLATKQECITCKEAAQAQAACENQTVESQFCLNTQYLLHYCQIQMVEELPIL